MELNLYVIVWTIINVTIMFYILSRFLFKPVKEFMDKRTEAIQKDINDAEALKQDAASLKTQYEEKMHSINEEKTQILLDAKKRGDKIYDERIEEATLDSDRVKERGRREIVQERAQMVDDLRSNLVNVALDAASKVISEELSEEKHKKLVSGFIDDLR